MSPQYPLVEARLLALLPTLSGWDKVALYNGPATGSDTVYCTVGWTGGDDPGTYQQDQDADGFQLDESGTVVGELVCATGANDLTSMKTQALTLIGQLEAAIRADRRLGVLSQEGTTQLRVNVYPIANKNGTGCRLVWSLTYYTVT